MFLSKTNGFFLFWNFRKYFFSKVWKLKQKAPSVPPRGLPQQAQMGGPGGVAPPGKPLRDPKLPKSQKLIKNQKTKAQEYYPDAQVGKD